MLEERALACKRKFEAAQKLADSSARTASRTDQMRQQVNPPSMTTRASSTERAKEGSDGSVGSSGRGGRRGDRTRTKNSNENRTGTATTDLPSPRSVRKLTGPELGAEGDSDDSMRESSTERAKEGSDGSVSSSGGGGDEGIDPEPKITIKT